MRATVVGCTLYALGWAMTVAAAPLQMTEVLLVGLGHIAVGITALVIGLASDG